MVIIERRVETETNSEAYPASSPNFEANNGVTVAIGQDTAIITAEVAVLSKFISLARKIAKTGNTTSLKRETVYIDGFVSVFFKSIFAYKFMWFFYVYS